MIKNDFLCNSLKYPYIKYHKKLVIMYSCIHLQNTFWYPLCHSSALKSLTAQGGDQSWRQIIIRQNDVPEQKGGEYERSGLTPPLKMESWVRAWESGAGAGNSLSQILGPRKLEDWTNSRIHAENQSPEPGSPTVDETKVWAAALTVGTQNPRSREPGWPTGTSRLEPHARSASLLIALTCLPGAWCGDRPAKFEC